MPSTEPTADLRDAAERLVRAFATADLDTYFACFADDATFVFHDTARVLASVDEYRESWRKRAATEEFAILECTTSEQLWQQWDDAAVLVHRVATVSTAVGRVQRSDERETIVFARRHGRWVAVHEHLSPHPAKEHG